MTRWRTFALAVFVLGCSSEKFSQAPATGGASGAAGASAAGGQGGTGASGGTSFTGGFGGTGGTGVDSGWCDTTKSPADDACLITEAYGIFVSPTGDDATGDGSKSKPFKTLSKGIAAAGAAGKSVYACDDGSGYIEPQTLELSALDGHGLFGGFNCAYWGYSKSTKARLYGATTAVSVTSVSQWLAIENFEIVANPAPSWTDSSFGAIVSSSDNVTFRRTKITAGAGGTGIEGAYGDTGAPGGSPNLAQQGKAATCTNAPATQPGGAWPTASACGSLGGPGGAAQKAGAGSNGTPGTPLTNVTPAGVLNGGNGASVPPASGTSGTQGSPGNSGANGQAAAAIGIFGATGYSPANGFPGTDGSPGQGGGGGGASATTGLVSCTGASGGAGGMGGCAGKKGLGGGGGGASVALLSWQSYVTLESVELVGGKGGNGGKGGSGGDGGNGSSGAPGGGGTTGVGQAGDGGKGGKGGDGGSGAGGTGGPSYALVFSGPVPTKLVFVTLTAGTGGLKGPGGSVGNLGVNPAPDGSQGLAGQEYEQK